MALKAPSLWYRSSTRHVCRRASALPGAAASCRATPGQWTSIKSMGRPSAARLALQAAVAAASPCSRGVAVPN